MQEFLAWAKQRGGKVNAGLAGVGAMHHLVTEMVKLQAGVQWTNVPYKGSAPMVLDLVGGQVDVGVDNIPSSLQLIKTGKLRALAVTSEQRTPLLPDVPTLAQAGVPGVVAAAWHGVLAPAGTPPEIVNRLNVEIVKILRSPETVAKLAGPRPRPGRQRPEDLRRLHRVGERQVGEGREGVGREARVSRRGYETRGSSPATSSTRTRDSDSDCAPTMNGRSALVMRTL